MCLSEIGTKCAWKHDEHLKGVKLLLGEVVKVTETEVVLASGITVGYDYLALSPGCGGGAGKAVQSTLEERRAFYAESNASLAAAKAVIVVGGGPTGVELVAEIAKEFKGLTCTLVTAGEILCPTMVAKAGKLIKSELEAMGVKVMTGTRMAKSATGSGYGTKTEAGVELGEDALVFDCTGSQPLTGWAVAPGGHPALLLNEGGAIIVTKELHVPGAPHIFALGDAAATEDANQAHLATTNQVPTVAANILASIDSKPLKAAASGPNGVMIITLGSDNGVAQLPGGHVAGGWWTSWLPTMLKSKSLFIGKVRGEFGLSS